MMMMGGQQTQSNQQCDSGAIRLGLGWRSRVPQTTVHNRACYYTANACARACCNGRRAVPAKRQQQRACGCHKSTLVHARTQKPCDLFTMQRLCCCCCISQPIRRGCCRTSSSSIRTGHRAQPGKKPGALRQIHMLVNHDMTIYIHTNINSTLMICCICA